MRKLLKKRVNIFGKTIPVFVIVLLGLGLVSAALIPLWGTITGLVTVSQGFSLNGLDWGAATITEPPVTMYSLEEKTVEYGPYFLENLAEVDAEFVLSADCQYEGENCDGDVTPVVEYLLDSAKIPFDPIYWYTLLTTEFEEGMEVVTIILPEGTTLSSLGDITFDENALSGYPVSVNILLDMDGNGVFESRKDLTTGDLTYGTDDVLKIESNYNGGTPENWVSVNSITSATNAWLYSAQPGAEGLVIYTLAKWITGASNDGYCYYTTTEWIQVECGSISVSGTTKVYGIQIESLGWIEESSSVVSNIVIDNVAYEISELPAGEKTDFQIVTDFPKMLVPGEYTITTTVGTVE